MTRRNDDAAMATHHPRRFFPPQCRIESIRSKGGPPALLDNEPRVEKWPRAGEKTLLNASPRRVNPFLPRTRHDATFEHEQKGEKGRLNDVSRCSSFHGVPSCFIFHRSNFESWIAVGRRTLELIPSRVI